VGKPKPKLIDDTKPDSGASGPAPITSPRRKLHHELSPEEKKLEQESQAPAVELDLDDGVEPTVELDDEPVTDPDDDAAFLEPEPEFTWSVSDTDPSVVFVPVTATRETIGTQLDVPFDIFYPVGTMEATPPTDDQQGIRFYNSHFVSADVKREMQKKFDALLDKEVQATVDALVGQKYGWHAAEYFLRWSQYSGYLDANGNDYFDAYIEALEGRTITTTKHHWIADDTVYEKNGVDELLDQTSGDVHKAIERARARSYKHSKSSDEAYSASGELPLGHVVGRYITGTDTAAVAAHIGQVLVGPTLGKEEAEIRTRNAAFMGSKVMICGESGYWRGYGLVFDVYSANVGTAVPPVVGGTEEHGRFYWYYHSTVFFGGNETDPNGPVDQPAMDDLQREILGDALGSKYSPNVVALDFGALRKATISERVELIKIITSADLDDPLTNGYTATQAAEAMARIVMTLGEGEFLDFVAALEKEGLLKKLASSHDVRLAPLGQAFTYQSLLSVQYGPNAFSEPTKMSQGSEDPDASIDYYLADPHDAGDGTTAISFEHGTSGTAWGDTDPWTVRSKELTRDFAPTELLTIENISESGRSERIVSAFEAAVTQGDPEGEVHGKVFWSFMDFVMLLEGGASLLKLGELGLKAAATGSLRMALKYAARELATKAGKAALRGVVDFALYNASRYAQKHEEELQKTPEGRAFLAILTTVTVMMAARDIGALVESGAIGRLVQAGRAALGVVGKTAAQAVAKAVDAFKAAGIAWTRLEEEGLLLSTNVGGLVMRRPRSLADLTNAFSVAQAQVAGENLLGTLAAGSAEHTRAAGVLGELESAAGGFSRGAGAKAPTEAEVAAGQAYRNLAKYAKGLNAAEQEKLFEAVKKLINGKGSRSVAELSPFITAGVRAIMKNGVDAEAYFAAVAKILGKKGLSREGLARLGNNALGKNPADIIWLSERELTDADLDFIALDPHAQWAKYHRATLPGASDAEKIRANTAIRGTAAEMVATEEASALVPGFRVEQRQVVTPGGSEIDVQLISTDRLGRRRPMEVKGFTRKTWQKAFDAFAPDHANPTATLLDAQRGKQLADPMANAGLRSVEGMLDQLKDASALASRGEKPILAVTSKLNTTERNVLKRILADNGIDAEIVYLSEDKILATSRRLGKGFGWR
jgi:hypothetical protein